MKHTKTETPTEPMEKRVKQIADMIGREAYCWGSARGDRSPIATVWANIADDLEAAADFIAEAALAKTDPQALAKFLQAPAPVCNLEARPPEDPPDWGPPTAEEVQALGIPVIDDADGLTEYPRKPEETAAPEASGPAIIPCKYPQGSPVVIIPEFGEPVTGADAWYQIIIEDSEPDDNVQEILLDRHGEGPDRLLGVYIEREIGRIFEELRLLVNDSNAAAIIMPEADAGHVTGRPLKWG